MAEEKKKNPVPNVYIPDLTEKANRDLLIKIIDRIIPPEEPKK